MEIDPGLSAQAGERLKAAGYEPRLVVGDGAEGFSGGAPYSRVHVTCAVSQVPYAWIEQTRPGGVIVLPYAPGFGYGTILRLDVLRDGTAMGRFHGSADFMVMRPQRPAGGGPGAWVDAGGRVTKSVTRLDPRHLRYGPPAMDLVIATLVRGVVSRYYDDTEPTGEATLWVLDAQGPGGPWTAVDYVPGRDAYDVEQAGGRCLWEEVQDAYFKWLGWGRPDLSRFGMTVTPSAEMVWLDEPGNII